MSHPKKRPTARLPAVTVSVGERALVDYVSAEAGLTMTEWIRRVVLEAARREMGDR